MSFELRAAYVNPFVQELNCTTHVFYGGLGFRGGGGGATNHVLGIIQCGMVFAETKAKLDPRGFDGDKSCCHLNPPMFRVGLRMDFESRLDSLFSVAKQTSRYIPWKTYYGTYVQQQ